MSHVSVATVGLVVRIDELRVHALPPTAVLPAVEDGAEIGPRRSMEVALVRVDRVVRHGEENLADWSPVRANGALWVASSLYLPALMTSCVNVSTLSNCGCPCGRRRSVHFRQQPFAAIG
jgi:hypothetical protein